MSVRIRVVLALFSAVWVVVGAVHLAAGATGPAAVLFTVSVVAGAVSLAANGLGYYLGRRR